MGAEDFGRAQFVEKSRPVEQDAAIEGAHAVGERGLQATERPAPFALGDLPVVDDEAHPPRPAQGQQPHHPRRVGADVDNVGPLADEKAPQPQHEGHEGQPAP